MNAHLVHGGVFAHVGDGLLEVFGVAMNPLAAIAALGDGVELFETEVTWFSHQKRAKAGRLVVTMIYRRPVGMGRSNEESARHWKSWKSPWKSSPRPSPVRPGGFVHSSPQIMDPYSKP